MVPESEKPRKNLAAGAARLLESPQERRADRVDPGCRTSFIWPVEPCNLGGSRNQNAGHSAQQNVDEVIAEMRQQREKGLGQLELFD